MALVLAAGGVVLDIHGREVVLRGDPDVRVEGCFAGSPDAASRLCRFSWKALEEEPKRPVRVVLGYPRRPDEARFARAAVLTARLGPAAGHRPGPEEGLIR